MLDLLTIVESVVTNVVCGHVDNLGSASDVPKLKILFNLLFLLNIIFFIQQNIEVGFATITQHMYG
ncbi:hypothetical protein A3195_14055 [Candidatus Thiodiazotropha endoloripes]|uniref:Uncharacterized protein n=1 Tax=Candidatus Thiodiazotropha endoloripes TaxID=1818881 RepID=A0A1E2UTD6_9GAMM|nr:hypothetical protein A3194_14625 [Candidatus Thiodiazotropha endoloripes]ODB86702.1 hypothetical protein A3195_14055 [Candidatus Thiodiazotropha endoloripes]ODB97842.1 hypothetical protein A3196_14395 [Candidatus Thiodiazotropha endoloripes]